MKHSISSNNFLSYYLNYIAFHFSPFILMNPQEKKMNMLCTKDMSKEFLLKIEYFKVNLYISGLKRASNYVYVAKEIKGCVSDV